MKISKKIAALLAMAVVAANTALASPMSLGGTAAVDDGNDDWLHAVGSRLYDKDGNEVWLTGANWFGFNCSENCAHGLYAVDCDEFLSSCADHGINVIRFPISSELLVSWMEGTPNEVSSVQAGYEPPYVDINRDFAGIKIVFSDLRDPENVRSEVLHYEGGIRQFVEHIHATRGLESMTDKVIYVSGMQGDSFAEIAMQYNDSYNEVILSFANNIHTIDGGSHEAGFKTALTKVINEYGKKFGLLKDGEKLAGDDVREGLTAIISVKLTECEFEGQTKGRLGNPEVKPFIEKLVTEKLMNYLEENPDVAKLIFEKSMAALRAREAAKKARENERNKAVFGKSPLPEKLADCSERDNRYTEIYIVEGDSAGGSAKQGRDRRYQAILSLWGKMLNVEKARIDRIYGNDKLSPVVTALGTSIGEDFDITKLRYGKIIIMADADVDGAHIRTLLLTFFFRFMRPLISNGNVYIAQPPLFRVSRGKKLYYAFSDEERDKYIAELADEDGNSSKVEVQRYKGLGEMDPEQLWETTMDPERRTIIKVEMEDAMRADEVFTILMGDKVEPRREFIEKNAKFVKNLDV